MSSTRRSAARKSSKKNLEDSDSFDSDFESDSDFEQQQKKPKRRRDSAKAQLKQYLTERGYTGKYKPRPEELDVWYDPNDEEKRAERAERQRVIDEHHDWLVDQCRRADIVLCTFEVLQSEVNMSREIKYKFRREPRHRIPKSPLLSVQWERCVLDETQEINSTTKQVSTMANRLRSQYKWAVSGTPIGRRGLDDLFGLVYFLQIHPFVSMRRAQASAAIVRADSTVTDLTVDDYSDIEEPDEITADTSAAQSRTVWQSITDISHPLGQARLIHLLDRVLWRHCKRHIRAQLPMPPLRFSNVWLTFSPLESEYYRRTEASLQAEVSSTLGFFGASENLSSTYFSFHR